MIAAFERPIANTLEGARQRGVLWEAAPGRFLLRVPGVARYLVEHGTTVSVDIIAGADQREVERFLATSPLAALHLQRGEPVLHAAVVRPPGGGGVHLLVGDSSSGKSTLALVLWRRGWSVVADDLAPIVLDGSGVPSVWPTSTDLVVWPDAIRGDDVGAEPWGPMGQRRRIVCTDDAPDGPVAIGAIWRIGAENFPVATTSDVAGADRFQSLSVGAWNSRIADALLDRTSYFRVAAAIAGGPVSMRRLVRARGAWTGDDLADVVEAHVV